MLGYIRYGDGPKRPEAGLLRLPAGTMAVLSPAGGAAGPWP